MRLTTIIFIFFVVSLCSWAQQPKRLTQKFFPDVDTILTTPAFESPFGFTKYKELISFLEELESQSEYCKIEYIGKTQKGKNIPVVLLSKPVSENKIRVWLQGGIHGNEPASAEGMLTVLQSFTQNPSKAYLLDHLDIAIAPMVNIDGYIVQNRLAKNGLDMNRDLIKLQIPEIQQLKKYYSDFAPHVSIDFHEYNPFRSSFRQLGAMGVTSYYDAMFLYSGNLNIHPTIKELTKDLFVQTAKNKFDELGYTHHDYFSSKSDLGKLYFNVGSTSARSSATSFALGNSISVLMEIRGVKLNRTSFERRVLITQEAAFSFLETAYFNYEDVYRGVNQAIASTIAMEEKVVADSKRVTDREKLKFIDFAENKVIETEFDVATSIGMEPSIIRVRPYAYLLSADQTEAIKNLEILGLKIENISSQKLEVETYRVTNQQIAPEKYQGYFPNTVQVEVKPRTIDFSDGTYLIKLNQKNANLAITALEPENSDGFIKTRVVEASIGEEIPVYRLMSPIE